MIKSDQTLYRLNISLTFGKVKFRKVLTCTVFVMQAALSSFTYCTLLVSAKYGRRIEDKCI